MFWSISKSARIVAYATGESKLSQNKEKDEDLRIRRTRKMLLEALMQLTVEKGFAAVTVGDITERAMVNRSTFYRHFLDKYDLLDKVADEVYEIFAATEDKFKEVWDANPPPQVAPPGLVALFQHVQQYADFYRVMLGAKGDPAFRERFRRVSERRMRMVLSRNTPNDPNAPPIEMKVQYVSHAGIGAIVWWLENNQPCTPEQLAKWVSQLSTGRGAPPPEDDTKSA